MKAHLSGLERDTSRVERDALADEHKRGSVRCAALVMPAHQVRRSTINVERIRETTRAEAYSSRNFAGSCEPLATERKVR